MGASVMSNGQSLRRPRRHQGREGTRAEPFQFGATDGLALAALHRPSYYALARALSPALFLAVFVFVPVLCAEDLAAEQEAAIIKQETEDEAKLPMDKAPPPGLSGRVQLNGDATDEADAVIGLFVVNGRGYQLRLGRTGLLAQLQPMNGKPATLIGKVRMRGKYFIVSGVDVPTPGPATVDRARKMSM